MTSTRPDATRNALYATSAVVTLIAEPTTADVSLSPSFLRTATTPKHTADRIGSASRLNRKPSRLPPSESSVVPATITAVPSTIGTVMLSPSSTIASAVDTKGFRLISAAAIEAPTFSIDTNRSRRPPTVPIRPADMQKRAPRRETCPRPPVAMTAVQRLTVPTTTLTKNPVYGSLPRSPCRIQIVASPEKSAPPRARRCRVCGIMWRRSSYSEVPMRRVIIPLGLAFMTCLAFFGSPRPVAAAPEGTVTWGVHITLASRWLDPAETEGIITPFMFLYALHDALVKPMPAGWNTPSLAESWTQSKDGLTYDFVLRKGIKFHNGDPVTTEDVKFSYDRYRGAGAKLLKERVKDVQLVDAGRIRFVLKEPWPDFMTFYGTSATGSGWVVPKKYVEKVGDDGFKRAPIGAGPYKVVSFTPGVELVMEAFEGYWRKVPAVKRLVFRSMPDETTRAAALKAGEVDIVYLLSGPTAEEIKRSPGLRLAAAVPPGVPFLDLPEQWDPKSPWHDQRVRLAASYALDRNALNQAETLGLSRPTGALIPRSLEFARPYDPPRYDPARAKQLLAEAGYPQGFDAGDLTPFPPYFGLAEGLVNYLQAVGIRTRLRTMERAAFLTAWREKKLKGVIMGLGAPAGNAATRIEAYVTKGGIYASGVVPEIEDLFQRQAREMDRKKREGMLHQIQQIMHDRVLHVPIYELAFLWGVGPRVEEACVDHIKGFSYSAPYEDLKLRAPR